MSSWDLGACVMRIPQTKDLVEAVIHGRNGGEYPVLRSRTCMDERARKANTSSIRGGVPNIVGIIASTIYLCEPGKVTIVRWCHDWTRRESRQGTQKLERESTPKPFQIVNVR